MLDGRRRKPTVCFWVFAVLSAVLLGGVVVPAAAYAEAYSASSARRSVDLDQGWRFHRGDAEGAQNIGYDDAGWARVAVPHTWNAEDGQDDGGDYYRGVGWYRRHLVVPAGMAGRKLWLQFDGANTTTNVWVNGTRLGEHKGGYSRFRFDATGALRAGRDNVIAVSVSNAQDSAVAPLSGDFTMGGGIYRDVSLVVTQRLHVDMLELMAGLTDLVEAEQPGGMSAYASCCVSDRGGLTGHTEISGYNKYFGWYTDSTADFGKWADELHAADPWRKFGMSEYGAGASAWQHEENPARPVPDSDWHPEEYQAVFHEDYWRAIQSRPYLWGGFVWVMFDFASDGRSEGDTYGRNDKGLVTGDRKIRKDAYYWYQANWTSTPVVHIASSRWVIRSASTTVVKAYTNADTVTLRVNGEQVGPAQSGADRVVVWPGVSLRPGRNTVAVSGVKDGRVHTDEVIWIVAS